MALLSVNAFANLKNECKIVSSKKNFVRSVLKFPRYEQRFSLKIIVKKTLKTLKHTANIFFRIKFVTH